MLEASVGAQSFFTDLVDAVRYSESWSDCVERQAEARKELQRQLDALDELQTRTAGLFETKKLDPDIAEPLAAAVNDFVDAATKQSRSRITEKLQKAVSELSEEANSLKLKAVKSLESFLATTPLLVLDEEVGVDLSESSYAAFANCKCSGNIEYEFLLNAAVSQLFGTGATASAVWKGTKLPVRLSKAWLKKEPVPDYEKLDNYTLSNARASRNHLSATLTNHDIKASATIVFSRSNSEAFVTIEYSDGAGKVDVTGEPSLNRHLDLGGVKQKMGIILDSMTKLDSVKLRLVRLVSMEEDILASLNCYGFMHGVVGAFLQSPETMQVIRKLDHRMTKERLKLLGEHGNAISAALGLDMQGAGAGPPSHP